MHRVFTKVHIESILHTVYHKPYTQWCDEFEISKLSQDLSINHPLCLICIYLLGVIRL